MATLLRIELAGGLYHMPSRGDLREDMYVYEAACSSRPGSVPEQSLLCAHLQTKLFTIRSLKHLYGMTAWPGFLSLTGQQFNRL